MKALLFPGSGTGRGLDLPFSKPCSWIFVSSGSLSDASHLGSVHADLLDTGRPANLSQHPNLGFGVLSTIRYLAAKQYDYAFCISFNRNFLKMQGMTDEEIEKIEADPLQAPLDDKDRAMEAFVMRAIKTPDAIERRDVDQLHEHGWTDSDILDALSHGTNMVASSIRMKAFKMDQVC